MTATNKTGVFSLEKITDRQSNNKWSTILDPYIFLQNTTPVTNHGYFTGGYSPSVRSTTNRIDFDNDTSTAVTKGPLTKARYSITAFAGNQTAGHMCGGYDGADRTSTHDRLDYANDSNIMESKANLNWQTHGAAATGNTEKGYWWGGRNNAYTPNYLTYVDRITYSNSTVTAMPRSTTQGNGRAAAGNANYGWWSGAQQTETLPYMRSWVWRLDYGNDTAAPTPKGHILTSGYGHSAAGNSNYGWHVGGSDGVPSRFTYISRIDYANDTNAALSRSNTSTVQRDGGGTGNANYGYFTAGYGGFTIMSRIDYANDTTTPVIRNIMPGSQIFEAGTSPVMNGFPTTPITSGDPVNGTPIASNGPNTGYAAGGRQPSSVPSGYDGGMSVVDRIDYANDTANASVRGSLPSGYYSWGNTGTSTLDYGYVTSGYNFNSSNPPTGRKTTLMRTDYSNDLATPSLRGGLIQQKYYAAAMGNVDYGYWGGGDPSPRNYLQRFDWSNDSANSVLKSPFSGNRYSMGATGTPSYAYFGGGDAYPQPSSPSNSSRIERLDMSNDDAAVVQKGSLQRVSSQTAGTGSPAYGYWHQVSNPGTTYVERIDYANDTANAVDKGPLSVARKKASLIGSRDYGYWMTGQDPYNATTRVDRLDFNNDTNTATPKGPMSSARYASAGTFSSRANALAAPQRIRFIDGAPVPRGYFAGGFNNNIVPSPSRLSSIERYDFSNDTNTASQVGSLINNGAMELGSISSPAFSYFIGGSGVGPNTSTGPYMTTIQRLDLTNETFTTRGNTSGIWYRINVTGNANYGYISGINRNTPWPYGSKIERIDFSNDNGTGTMPGAVSTFPASQGGPRAAVSSSNYGYYGGGHTPSPLSTVERLDFGNDTSNLVTKGPLSVARQGLGALASPAYGYFGGGIANPGGTYYSTIDRIDFANDTAVASPKSILTVIKKEFAGVSNSSYGYFSGGYNIVPGGNNYLSSTDRIDFANDTANTVSKGTLTFEKNHLTGTSAILAAPPAPVEPPFPSPTQAPAPGPSMGYTLGGSMPYSYSTVDRKDYSNDTVAASVKGPLSAGTSYHAGVSNKTHGYSLGGKTPSNSESSKVDRVDYANDTVVASVKGNLSVGYYRSYAGVGNKEYGYVIGGGVVSPWSTYVQRVEYASDTSTATTKGPMAGAVYLNGGTGNLSYGYSTGGSTQAGGATNQSVVERLDYASDTSQMVVKGPLAQGCRKNTATGTASYGYVGGGQSPDYSKVQRIDYANDTLTAVAKSPLSINRNSFSSFSSPAYGYFNGGNFPNISLVERMDYASDTTAASTKGPLSGPRGYMPGVSAQDIGGALN